MNHDTGSTGKTIINEVKASKITYACNNCFKYVDSARLSAVAPEWPICEKCETKRSANRAQDKLAA